MTKGTSRSTVMLNLISKRFTSDDTISPSTTNVATSSIVHDVTGNMSQAPEGCYVFLLQEMEFLPWDNPDNIVSAEVEDIIRRLKDVMLPIFFLIGAPANVINMAVFYKQGLKERVSLCLFALSLADELFLINMMCLYSEQLVLPFTTKERFGPVMRFMVNHNLVGFFGFSWVSQVLSAIIASERCLCVISPLRFQTLLPTRTMAGIVSVVYVAVVGLYFVVAMRYRIECVYDPASDTVVYTAIASEFYLSHQLLIDYIDSFVYGAGIPGLTIIVGTTTTIITAVKIRQAATWRAETAASGSSSSSMPLREVALTKMLIGISVLFIVCVSPLALFRFACLLLPEVNTGRRNQNIYLSGLWILEAFAYVNSSVNVFVYYAMGSRYRETFWSLFRKKKRDKAQERSTMTKTTKI